LKQIEDRLVRRVPRRLGGPWVFGDDLDTDGLVEYVVDRSGEAPVVVPRTWLLRASSRWMRALSRSITLVMSPVARVE